MAGIDTEHWPAIPVADWQDGSDQRSRWTGVSVWPSARPDGAGRHETGCERSGPERDVGGDRHKLEQYPPALPRPRFGVTCARTVHRSARQNDRKGSSSVDRRDGIAARGKVRKPSSGDSRTISADTSTASSSESECYSCRHRTRAQLGLKSTRFRTAELAADIRPRRIA
jgi:hypothetical protein